MVKAVNHNTSSAVVNTGWSTVKGGILGFVATALLGAAIAGGALVAGGALIGAIFGGGAIAGATAMVTGAGALVTGIAAIAGGVTTASTVGTAGAAIGGVAGLLGGGSRVSAESQAFRDKVASRGMGARDRVAEAHHIGVQQGAQQGYMMGVQDGQQMVVQKLREMQYASIQDQMAHAAHKHCGTQKCSHAEAEMKRRETAAAAQQAR